MHKDAIWHSQKVGLLNLVKSPIGVYSSFKFYLEARELAKSSRKDNKGWKDNSYILLLGERDGCYESKKQVNYT